MSHIFPRGIEKSSGQEPPFRTLEAWQGCPSSGQGAKYSPQESWSPCFLKYLRTKLFNNHISSQINNPTSPRFMTSMHESISSERMTFLCPFQKQAVSHDKRTHHPNNPAAFRPLLQPTSLPASECNQQDGTYGAHGARVQILTLQSHIPQPDTHGQSLLRVYKMNRSRKNVANITFSTTWAPRSEYHSDRFMKTFAESGT